jgi:hypothetical protein
MQVHLFHISISQQLENYSITMFVEHCAVPMVVVVTMVVTILGGGDGLNTF